MFVRQSPSSIVATMSISWATSESLPFHLSYHCSKVLEAHGLRELAWWTLKAKDDWTKKLLWQLALPWQLDKLPSCRPPGRLSASSLPIPPLPCFYWTGRWRSHHSFSPCGMLLNSRSQLMEEQLCGKISSMRTASRWSRLLLCCLKESCSHEWFPRITQQHWQIEVSQLNSRCQSQCLIS